MLPVEKHNSSKDRFSWYSFDKIKAEKFFGFYFVYLMLVDFVV